MYLFIYLIVDTLILVSTEAKQEIYKGRYTRDLKDFEIVVPKKVTENGEFVSDYLPHFYNIDRVKRGVDTAKVHYVLPVGGVNRILELTPAEDFHAPGVVIEHHVTDARNNLNSVKLRRPRKQKCYYHGQVKEEPMSSAAITTCLGLAGSIRIGTTQYLIEPVDDDEKPTVDAHHRHLLYKRSHQQGFNRSAACGTTGNFKTSFKKRMEWEEKYGRRVEESMKGMEDPFWYNHYGKSVEKTLLRAERWCTTCYPNTQVSCQTPYPPCEIPRPLFVELLVVVGPRVALTPFLDDDTEQYVNTVINIAVQHFQDNSLGRPIKIKLVRMVTMGFLYPELDPRRYDPQVLLKHFCDWQMHFNPNSEEHPNHHDFAIYLVKFEQCQGSLLGLTHMASMCRPDKSCAVISEEGLLTGHIITHMLGHSLGADHDDVNLSGCCPEEPDGTCYHMGPNICSWATAFSVCTRQCILQFVNTHAAWCITDVPTEVEMTSPMLLPGQVYLAAEQCRITFEVDTYACLVGEFCKRLYCKINNDECVSTGEPPAQGTRCGPNQWCFNGRCVHRGSRPGVTNGEWGVWSHWTPCTKTCGGGVQSAHRACNSPAPSQGGSPCSGSWVKTRMCNVGSCPDAGKGFLDQQCKNTNARPYHGTKHEWLYYNQQIEDTQCVVICINEKREVAVRSPLAVDGTFCNAGTKDVCVHGICKSVGCDWVIGSKAKEDACGVCHGNGTECHIMQGFFGDTNFQGLIQFLKLPIGTSMILVRETRPSPCFFVITNSVNSSYYLNNDNQDRQYLTGAFKIQGTTGIYQLKAEMERIFIKEPLKVPITLSYVCHELEGTIGILYQYALPEPKNPSVAPIYTWEFLSWGKCQHPCGGAIQRSVPVCVEAQGGEVEDIYCSIQEKPADKIRVCNQHPCVARWWVGPWAQCECFNNEGITTRMIMCALRKDARSAYVEVVNEEECVADPKPLAEKPCDLKKNREMWLKKEYNKRDLADMIPYTKDFDDVYSVWDEIPEDTVPYVVNVRNIIHSLDPEDVNDYVYMKKTGVTERIWKKLNEDRESGVRVRRRRQKITPTTQVTTKNGVSGKPSAKHKKQSKTATPDKELQATTSITTAGNKKHTSEAVKKNEDRALKKSVEKLISTAKTTPAKMVAPTTATSVIQNITEKTVQIVNLVTHAVEYTGTGKAPEIATLSEVTVSAYRGAEIPVTLPARKTYNTEKLVTTFMPTTTVIQRSEVTEKITAKIRSNDGTEVTSEVGITEQPVKGTGKEQTEATMTVPQVLVDPGLTGFSEYASDTPAPQKKCWNLEIKMPHVTPTCRPAGDAAPEPAEAAPEMDFMNKSNIKVYLVPIQTTIRSIIQSDQEFVMMDTLAKFPVADELSVVEHRGETARRQLKYAKEKEKVDNEKPSVQE